MSIPSISSWCAIVLSKQMLCSVPSLDFSLRSSSKPTRAIDFALPLSAQPAADSMPRRRPRES